VQLIQKGYGEVRLVAGESVTGEISMFAEGWIAVAPVPPSRERAEVRWFPNQQVAELVWRKSLAMRPREEAAG
jgi:hypothetical protein